MHIIALILGSVLASRHVSKHIQKAGIEKNHQALGAYLLPPEIRELNQKKASARGVIHAELHRAGKPIVS